MWKTLGALAATRATPAQLAALTLRYAPEQDEAETAGLASGVRLVEADGLCATAELHGYLAHLRERLRSADGAKAKPISASRAHDSGPHRAGVAIDLKVDSPSLRRLLKEDWLFDRIYKTRLPDGRIHVCLNPRFGLEFVEGESARQAPFKGATGAR